VGVRAAPRRAAGLTAPLSPARDRAAQKFILLSARATDQNPRRAGTLCNHRRAPTSKGTNMTRLILAAGLALFALQATAEPTCQAMAAENKLAGAAKASFIKKCEKDARAKCETAADKQKLAGAARNGNVRRCLQETTGPHSNASCELSADAKGLAGAARSSHVKKCMREG
jgi:hypothetical protein